MRPGQHQRGNGCYIDVIHPAVGTMRSGPEHTDKRMVEFNHIHWDDGWRVCLGQHRRHAGQKEGAHRYIGDECFVHCRIVVLPDIRFIHDFPVFKWCRVSLSIHSALCVKRGTSASTIIIIHYIINRLGGSGPVIWSYFAEFQPKSKRGSMLSFMAAFWTVGNLFVAGLAWWIIPSGKSTRKSIAFAISNAIIKLCSLSNSFCRHWINHSVFHIQLLAHLPFHLCNAIVSRCGPPLLPARKSEISNHAGTTREGPEHSTGYLRNQHGPTARRLSSQRAASR